jgi:hypothetical protein
MRSLVHNWWVGLLILTLTALSAAAQDQSGQQGQQDQNQQSQQSQGQSQQDQNQSQGAQPIPAYHSPFAEAADNGNSEPETELPAADTRSPSGAQILAVAGPELVHSYWQPHVDLFGTADSNAQETPSGSSWGTWFSFSGGVDLHRVATASDLTVSYLGGAAISSTSSVGNGIVQQLGIDERLIIRRWTLSFLDQAAYLPESGFGYGGLGGTALSAGSVNLGSTFTNSQSLLTGQGQNLTNSFVTEADVAVTPRTSFTFVGGYSLLHYFDNNLLNSGDANFRGGFNYLWTRRDTIAVFYTYSAFRFSNFDEQSIDEHTIQASYARRVTGRLAFQIAAGPQIVILRIPISNSSGSGSTNVPGSSTQFNWALNSSVNYQLRRTALQAAYSHGVTAGSGVLAGASTDMASGSVTRQMSRTFSSDITGGYARNQGVVPGVGVATPSSQTYDYWFAGASFSYPWGRTLGLTFAYQFQYQNSNGQFCITAANCGTNVMRHMISVGLGWHERPIVF